MTTVPAAASPTEVTTTPRRGPHPGWSAPPVLAATAFGCALIWTASYPGVPFVGVGLVAVCVLALGAAGSLDWMRSPSSARLARRRWIASIVSLALLVGSVAFTVTGMPLRARFAASRTAFDAVVAAADGSSANVTRSDVVRAGEQNLAAFPIRCPTTVGEFSIAECELTDDGGYLFVQKWNALTDNSGIAYLPNGPIPWTYEKPHHLTGAWYSWTCGC